MNPYFSDAMCLSDVMNMKPGDVFYLNHSHLKTSSKLIFSHYIGEKIHCVKCGEYIGYYMVEKYLSDVGVVPYNYKYSNEFNRSNYLSYSPDYNLQYN